MDEIIDTNAFFGSWPYWRIRHGDPKSLLDLASSEGIGQLWVSSLRSILLDWVDGNEETLDLCSRNPAKLLPVLTVTPFWVENPLDVMERYLKQGMRALRLCPSFQGYSIGPYDEFAEIVGWANAHGLPIIYCLRLFMNWGLLASPVDAVSTILKYAPRSPVILSGLNWGEIMKVLTYVKAYDNLYFDISCLALRRGMEQLLRKAGENRVLFGSALPFQNPHPILAHIRSLPVEDRIIEKVLSLNAQDVLGSSGIPN